MGKAVVFIHPPLGHPISGGNIYNRHIIEQAAANHYPLISLTQSPGILKRQAATKISRRTPRLVVWDSLFFSVVAGYCRRLRRKANALLIHYLPSLNPTLGSADRMRHQRIENAAIQKCGVLICTGERIFQRLVRRFPDRSIHLCEPGVNQRFNIDRKRNPYRDSPPPLNIISVANLLPTKGQLELLDVLSDLRQHAWIWHLAGDPCVDSVFSARFRECASRLRLADRIRLHGPVEHERLAELLMQMDLFINPSLYESYGMASAEAAAAGLAMIVTRTGDCDRFVHHGQSGFVVPVGNREALKHALETLIIDSGLRQQFSQFNRNQAAESWIDCFRKFKTACSANKKCRL